MKSVASRPELMGEVAPKLQNSLFFSLLARELRVETGSIATASATTHSFEPRDFLETSKWPAIGGLRRWCFVSAETNFAQGGISGELSLCPEIAVPGGRIEK